jgi:hypothetical protein
VKEGEKKEVLHRRKPQKFVSVALQGQCRQGFTKAKKQLQMALMFSFSFTDVHVAGHISRDTNPE